jgi:hypothetical protein
MSAILNEDDGQIPRTYVSAQAAPPQDGGALAPGAKLAQNGGVPVCMVRPCQRLGGRHPVAGATVTYRLSGYDVDDGYVGRWRRSTTDVMGVVHPAVPNELGAVATYCDVKSWPMARHCA